MYTFIMTGGGTAASRKNSVTKIRERLKQQHPMYRISLHVTTDEDNLTILSVSYHEISLN